MATVTSRAELMTVVASGSSELLASDLTTIWLRDGGVFRVAGWSGGGGELAAETALDASDPVVAEFVERGSVLPIPDTRSMALQHIVSLYPGGVPTGAVLAAPLLDGGACVGILVAATHGPREWSVGDAELAEALAAHAALALRSVLLVERLEARANQLAVVQAASARISRAQTVEAVGRAIVEEVAAMVDYHNARVYLFEPPDELIPIAFEGLVGAYESVDPALLRVKVGEGFTGWVALHGEPLLIPDANDDPRGVQIPGTDDVAESMVVVPVRHDDEVVGVITLSKLGLSQFDEDDLQVLSILADQATTALESARLLTRTETLAWELRRLLDLSSELAESLDPRLVGQVIARHLTLALGVDACAISSWDRSGDRIVSLGQHPNAEAVEAHPEYALAEYPETRRVLEELATVLVDAEDPAADRAEVAVLRIEGHRTLAMIPLIAKGQAVGVVELMANDLVEFDEGRLGLARTMANEAAMALENARLFDAARALADRDPLTGFYNHRFFHERLGEELVRARRTRRALSLLMIDLDDFKLVNDTFGHQFGDRFLLRLAEVVRGTLRASDVPARYGGDEFAVILPETDVDGAVAAAGRILRALESQPVVPEGRGPVPIAVSIGVSELGAATRATELIEEADRAMYAAKVAGGSRVLSAAEMAVSAGGDLGDAGVVGPSSGAVRSVA
jgi:diguanylate cyclase (GGDEF)-like protein